MLYATVDSFHADRGPVPFALRLCAAAGAGLSGFLLNLDANAPSGADNPDLASQRARSDERAARNAANAQTLVDSAARCGVAARRVTGIDHSRGVIGFLADHARLHDLLVMGTDGSGLLSDRLVAESLLFETGRPLLVVPPDHAGEWDCRRIAVAWDNSRAAARALGDALALLPGLEEVVLLTIGGEKAVRSSLDDAALAEALARCGVRASVMRGELRGRSIGDAIQDSAREAGAGLLVMGGYGHSRLRDFILGGATLAVLGHPRLPVLLSH